MADSECTMKEKMQTIYNAVNRTVLSLVPASAVRILDVGCGSGVLGEYLRSKQERYVVGITYSQEEAELASRRLSEVYCADLNNFNFEPLGKFDCVILSHILEHLYAPADTLERLKSTLQPESRVVVALPNVLWWKQRLEFLFGRWQYQDWGTLDRTHFRFFDRRSAAALLEDTGFEILECRYEGPFPLTRPIRDVLGARAEAMDRFLSALLPGLFATQFVYLLGVKP